MKRLNQLFRDLLEKDWGFIPAGLLLFAVLYYLGRSPNLLFWQKNNMSRLSLGQIAITRSFSRLSNRLENNQTQQIADLREENALLKQALHQRNTSTTHQVISYPYRLISIVGAVEPRVGSMVVADGVLLGQISLTSPYAAKVKLLHEINTQPILITTDSGVDGLIIGDGKRVILTEVPHSLSLKSGEKIWTVGQLEVMAGLFVGFIDQPIGELTDSAQKFSIKQPLEFSELNEVEVL